MNDNILPKKYTYHLLISGFLSIFFLLFAVVYEPLNIKAILADAGNMSYYFHIAMLSSIVLVVSLLSRLILWALSTKYEFPTWRYILFCLAELTIIASLSALYCSLFLDRKYLEILPDCEIFALLILIYPYSLSIIVRLSACRLLALNRGKEDTSIVKFYDENHRLKIAISPSYILFICADSNYVKINYIENDQVKVYLLRNSMKNITDVAEQAGLIRCHRSYFVNPQQIKSIVRTKDSLINAELKKKGLDLIPISRMYYNSIIDNL